METSGIKEIKGIWRVRHKSQGLETSRKIKINNHNFYPQQLKNVDLRAEVQDLRTCFKTCGRRTGRMRGGKIRRRTKANEEEEGRMKEKKTKKNE